MKQRQKATNFYSRVAVVLLVGWLALHDVPEFMSLDSQHKVIGVFMVFALIVMLQIGKRSTSPRWFSLLFAVLFCAAWGSIQTAVLYHDGLPVNVFRGIVGLGGLMLPIVGMVLWATWGEKARRTKASSPVIQDHCDTPLPD